MPSRTTCTITLAGRDAVGFAQAQFSSDVAALAVGQWQWSGWLDPKGRVRALLQMARPEEDRLVALLRGGDATTLVQDLQRFVFRSKVMLALSETLHISDGPAFEDGHMQVDGDDIVLGEGDASLRIGKHGRSDETWYARHIAKGYAWLPDTALGTLLPPALSMERLGAVAFDKGCFPGQEIAARLHFLGGHKRHLRVVHTDCTLQEGLALRANDRDIGIVLMHSNKNGTPTSLVVLDDAAACADTLETDEARLHIVSTFSA